MQRQRQWEFNFGKIVVKGVARRFPKENGDWPLDVQEFEQSERHFSVADFPWEAAGFAGATATDVVKGALAGQGWLGEAGLARLAWQNF